MSIASLTINFSSLDVYRQCPTKFSYSVLQGLAQSDTSALSFGTLIHYGIEQLNRIPAERNLVNETRDDNSVFAELEYLADGGMPSADKPGLVGVLNSVAFEAAKTPLFLFLPDQRRSMRHLLLLLIRYAQHYAPDPLKTDKLEVKHKAYLGLTRSGVQVFYNGTIDGLAGRKVIERKTTSYLNTGFINRINPNAQAAGYLFLARNYFKDQTLDTVVFDALSTSGYGGTWGSRTTQPARWAINANPASLFLRIETMRTDEQLAEWRADVLYDAERMVQDIERGRFSKYDPTPCNAYNSVCPYKEACMMNPSTRPPLLDNFPKAPLTESFAINQDFIV